MEKSLRILSVKPGKTDAIFTIPFTCWHQTILLKQTCQIAELWDEQGWARCRCSSRTLLLRVTDQEPLIFISDVQVVLLSTHMVNSFFFTMNWASFFRSKVIDYCDTSKLLHSCSNPQRKHLILPF